MPNFGTMNQLEILAIHADRNPFSDQHDLNKHFKLE